MLKFNGFHLNYKVNDALCFVDLFQKLFRQDLLVASLFRNFLLAERIMRSYDCVPVSSPSLPPTYQVENPLRHHFLELTVSLAAPHVAGLGLGTRLMPRTTA